MSTETRPDYSMWVTCAEGDCDQGHRTDCKDLRERAAAVAKQEAEPWRCAEHGGWPYDADRNDPLAALRIPVVSSPYPGWKYEVALVITDDDLWGPALRPAETEVRQIVAYIEYRMEYYNEGWRAKMRRKPLDVDSGTNTVTLMKRGDDDWCYRRWTWQTGPLMVPSRYDNQSAMGLEQLLDHIHLYGDSKPSPKWLAWKAAHPEAFPVSSEGGQES